MADGVVQLHDDGPGKKVDTTTLTVGGQTVHRQRVEVYSGEALPMSFSDSPALDAFSRLRISEAVTIFDSQQEYGLDTLRTWDATANGTLSSASPSTNGRVTSGSNLVGPRDLNTRLTPITCSSTDTHYSILQSKAYHRYIPGKSHLVFLTGVFASGASPTVKLVVRTSTSGSASDAGFATQANWNVDTFGAGVLNPSGITLDFTKTQILVISAQWLGVGRIVISFDVDGILYPAHYFTHANSLAVPYTQSFNLPIRMEVRTSGSTTIARSGYFDSANGVFLECTKATAGGTIQYGCCSVQSEGGVEVRGWPQSSPVGISSIGVTTRRPIISLRPKAIYNGADNRAHIEDLTYALRTITNDALIEVVVGGTLTGASWTPVGTVTTAGAFITGVTYIILTVGTTDYTLIGASANTIGVIFTATGAGTGTGTAVTSRSVAEYDVSATAISGGETIEQDFAISGGKVNSLTNAGYVDTRSPLVLSKIDALAATQQNISIVATSFTGTSNITSVLNWHEQVI